MPEDKGDFNIEESTQPVGANQRQGNVNRSTFDETIIQTQQLPYDLHPDNSSETFANYRAVFQKIAELRNKGTLSEAERQQLTNLLEEEKRLFSQLEAMLAEVNIHESEK